MDCTSGERTTDSISWSMDISKSEEKFSVWRKKIMDDLWSMHAMCYGCHYADQKATPLSVFVFLLHQHLPTYMMDLQIDL